MTSYQQLEPREVFHWFYELNQIPRCSNHEKAASDFLLKFARDRGLDVKQDEALNILIRKEGSPGYENAPTVILQGHMDMVCEKTADSTHDFSCDPIEMVVDGEYLRAKDTTLGGDDGIAVAFALAILDDDTLEHPPLEVLITTAEETGMDGAMAVKKGQLRGKYLLNIDSEDEGVFLVSCAGGATCRFHFPAEKKAVSSPAFSLSISGLQGGHSGQQIALGRGNALKILARLMQSPGDDFSYRFASIEGGSKHNAIPLSAKAVFCVEEGDAESFCGRIKEEAEKIKSELQTVDPELQVVIEKAEAGSAMSVEDSRRVVDFLFLTPDGVQAMSHDIHGLVQTSLNTAVLSPTDEGLELITSVRSSLLSSRHELIARLARLAELLGVGVSVGDGYPAWEYRPHSPLRDLCLKVWKEETGREGKVEAIHAGLECGLLSEVLPDTDMISFGPDLYDVHSTREKLRIASVKTVYDFTKALLRNIKA